MVQRIIYPSGGSVAVLICHGADGAPLCDLPVGEIARKDVPAGLPYRIIDDTDLPADRSQREFWTADFSEPDGIGIGAFAWHKEQQLARIGELLSISPPAPAEGAIAPEVEAAHAAFIAAVEAVEATVNSLPDIDPSPHDNDVLFREVPEALRSAWATYQEALTFAEEEPAQEEPVEEEPIE